VTLSCLVLFGCEPVEEATETQANQEASEGTASAPTSYERKTNPAPTPYCSWEYESEYSLENFGTKFLAPSDWVSQCVPPYANETVLAKDTTPSNGTSSPVEVVFGPDGFITEVGGVSCCPTGSYGDEAPDPVYFGCRQQYRCGASVEEEGKDGCEMRLEIFLAEHWEISVWDNHDCGMNIPGSDPDHNSWYFNYTPGGGGGGGLSSQACNDCISSCQGYSNCCTGLGCFCEDECKNGAQCSDDLIYCCGPNGDCYCWASCPY
jgi:hypothetical protein